MRPDSGEPKEIVVKVLDMLGKTFGKTENSKGYHMLPPYLRVIQGDGISYETIGEILEAMQKAGWSTENIVFGSGGALLQKLNRDTQKCAFKCSFAIVNGKGVDVFKDPITDSGKKSKRGKLTLERTDDDKKFITRQEGSGDPKKDVLVTVSENGKLLKDYTFEEIRKNAQIDLLKNAEEEPMN